MADGTFITKIQIGDTTHPINATQLSGHTYDDIAALITAGFTIEVPWTADDAASTTVPTATKLGNIPSGVVVSYSGGTATGTLSATSAAAKKHIYLVYHSHNDKDNFDEYVSTGNAWELIGNTDIDLSNYVTKGTVTSSSGSGSTGSAGAATLTTSSAGSQTATGTATISYQKVGSATGSANGSTSTNTGTAGAINITPTFTGTSATITLSGNVSGTAVDDHSYTPAGSISGSQSIAAHGHTVNVATPTSSTVIDSVSLSGGSINGATAVDVLTGVKASGSTTVVTGVTKGTGNALSSATVSTDGVLSFNSSTFVNSVSSTTATAVTGVAANGTKSVVPSYTYSAPSLSKTTTSVISALGAITVANGGATSIDFSKASFTGSKATLTHSVTQGSVSVSGSYTPEGSVSKISVAAHSHSYNAPAAHTHSISSASTTVTGTVEVAVSNHTHTVTVANHTHSIGNHTHSVN